MINGRIYTLSFCVETEMTKENLNKKLQQYVCLQWPNQSYALKKITRATDNKLK